MHVLLIEDNPADIYLLQEEFANLRGDHHLSVAKSIAEAQAFLAERRPDAAILDLSLPDSFGLETFLAVQAASPELPVVVLSGNADQTMAVDAVRSGAQDYVFKGETTGRDLLRTLTYSIERAGIKTQLRRSEARFRRLFDSVPVGVFQMNASGDLLVVNANLIATLGFAAEDDVLRAHRASGLFVNEDQRRESLQLLQETGLLNSIEVELYRRDGETVTMLVNAAVVKDDVSGDYLIACLPSAKFRQSDDG